MRDKLLSVLSMFIVAIRIYGPNIPSGQYAYSPEIPDEILKIRK